MEGGFGEKGISFGASDFGDESKFAAECAKRAQVGKQNLDKHVAASSNDLDTKSLADLQNGIQNGIPAGSALSQKLLRMWTAEDKARYSDIRTREAKAAFRISYAKSKYQQIIETKTRRPESQNI